MARRRTSDFSAEEARRIAVAAQGFADPRPVGRVDARHFRRVLGRLGLVQIDAVNVVARSHYLPFYARLGPYPQEALDEFAWSGRHMFEYWGHAASLIPLEDYPLYRHRMEQRDGDRWSAQVRDRFDAYVEDILGQVHERGPLVIGDLEGGGPRRGGWWGWSDAKIVVEHLFRAGRVAVTRRTGFQRLYDTPERAFPDEVRSLPAPSPEEAYRTFLLRAARHYGIGTAADLSDYYRVGRGGGGGGWRRAQTVLDELAEEGAIERVGVEGWAEPAYLSLEAKLPRSIEARAVVSPFDSLVWFRDRTERVWDFRYTLELYVPPPRRRFGYYVLPMLLNDQLVGRVDLKSDRRGSVLLARAAHVEEGQDPRRVAGELAAELRQMASWLGLERAQAAPRGNLGPALRTALGRGTAA